MWKRDGTFLISQVTSCDYATKGSMTFWVGAFYQKSPLCQVWWLYVLWNRWSMVIRLLFFNVKSCDHMIKETWLGQWEALTLSHHPTNFGAYRSSRSGDETFLICHVKSCDHMIKGHMTMDITIVPSLMLIGLMGVEMFLFCHMTLWSKGHVTW